jgi:hypothetical protein
MSSSFHIWSSGLFPSELIWNCGLYRQSVGFLGRGISTTQGRYLHRTTQTQKKRGDTFIPLVGFEPTIQEFVRAKTFHALDRAATVIGHILYIRLSIRLTEKTY